MECHFCSTLCIKKGFQKNRTQKFFCRQCGKYQQCAYQRKGCHPHLNQKIKTLVKECCGIRSIARIESIAPSTVMSRILHIASHIVRPFELLTGKDYEIDELKTYLRKKSNEYWITYAIRKDTRQVVDYKIGKRTKKNLQRVTDTLLLSKANRIYSDGYDLYRHLIPQKQHRVSEYKINHIERKNLSLRTHLKHLARKTICYSRSLLTWRLA